MSEIPKEGAKLITFKEFRSWSVVCFGFGPEATGQNLMIFEIQFKSAMAPVLKGMNLKTQNVL